MTEYNSQAFDKWMNRRKRRGIIPIAIIVAVLIVFLILVITGTDFDTFREEHGHSHRAPNGGTLVVLGMHDAHLEFVLDEQIGQLDLFVWDGHVEHPYILRRETVTLQIRDDTSEAWQEIQLHPVASPSDPGGSGRAAQFRGQSDSLVRLTRFQMRIPPLEIAGRNYGAIETAFPQGNE